MRHYLFRGKEYKAFRRALWSFWDRPRPWSMRELPGLSALGSFRSPSSWILVLPKEATAIPASAVQIGYPHGKDGSHHRSHRPGWRVSQRIAAGEGLQG